LWLSWGGAKGSPEGTKNRSHFWVGFGIGFGVKLRSKMGPTFAKMDPKTDPKNTIFWKPLFGGFGALEEPPGTPREPPKTVLGGLRTSKTFENFGFFKVFEKPPS